MEVLPEAAVGTQQSCSPPTVAQLLAENAGLRAKLSLTEAQRVAQDVAREQLSHFFADATRPSLPPAQRTEADGEDTVPEGDHLTSSASFPRGPVSEAIKRVTELADSAEARAQTLQESVVAPLNTRVESLEAEKAELLHQVQTLEMKLESQPAKPLVQELDLLRLSEGVLRDQLKHTQETAASRVEELVAVLTKSAGASHELSQQTKTIADLKTALRDVLHVNKFLQLEQEEQLRRHALEQELAAGTHEDELAHLRDERDTLRGDLHRAHQDAETLAREKEVAEERCAQLEEEMAKVKAECAERMQAAQEEATTSDAAPHASGSESGVGHKRRRAELEALLDDPASFRGEVLRFYYDGKESISALEAQVADLSAKAEALRIAQGRVVQLERASVVATAHITDLAVEVERLRGENKQQRASAAGLEAERDVLASTLAETLAGAMSGHELRHACDTIREAATKAAAASAAIVADPEAIRDATRQAQELKSEVAQLQRQKEQLQRLIQLRQTRVHAQLEKDVLAFTSTSTGGTRGQATLPLDHVLKRVEQCAKDIFSAQEVAAMGILDTYKAPTNALELASSVTPHKDSFLDCQRQMEALEKVCEEAKHQCTVEQTMHQHAREALARQEATAKDALESKDLALSSAHSANAALTAKLTSTTSTLAALRGQYDQVLTFAEQVLSSTRFVHDLLQSEHTYVDALRDQVRQEREAVCTLLRTTWSATETDPAHDPRVVASERVADSLARLVSYLTESVAEVRGRSEQETSAFVSRLADAIRQQETRVRALEHTFDEATRKQAASLLQRLTEAQQHWDSEWQRKYRALEEERRQWSRGHDAQKALYRRLEHADLSAPANGTESQNTHGSNEGSTPTHRERIRQTLETLEQFLASVRQAPPSLPPTVANPAPTAPPLSAADANAVTTPSDEQAATLPDGGVAEDAPAEGTSPLAGDEEMEQPPQPPLTPPVEPQDEEHQLAPQDDLAIKAETAARTPNAGSPDAVKKEEEDQLNTTE